MSTVQGEQRRAARVAVSIPTVVEVIGERPQTLHPALAAVYERVTTPREIIGQRFPAVLRDLSANGAFVTGGTLPLLSRIAFTFLLEGHGQVEALAWTMWRRQRDCEIPRDGGGVVRLPAGFGVLFESITLD